jgi:hypothetical protein
MRQHHIASPRDRRHAAVLWALCGLFAARVLGQALQKWLPLSMLPPFRAFQGSAIPYPMLLAAQLLILAIMGRSSWRVQHGGVSSSRRAAILLPWVGSTYIAASLARLAIGMSVPRAPAWFKAWISGTFHLVLAGFLVTLAIFHQRANAPEKFDNDQ